MYLFLLIVMLCLGIVFLARLAKRLQLGYQSKQWRQVKAVVIAAKIDGDKDSDGDEWFWPKITYSFKTPKGESVTSSNFTYRRLRIRNYGDAIDHLAAVRHGKEIDVYCNPNRPTQAVILPGVNAVDFVELCVLISFVATMGSAVMRYLVRFGG